MNRFTLPLAALVLSGLPVMGLAFDFSTPILTWPAPPATDAATPASQACFAPDQITPVACPKEN